MSPHRRDRFAGALRVGENIKIIGDTGSEERNLFLRDAVNEQWREADQATVLPRRDRPDFAAAEQVTCPREQPFRRGKWRGLFAPFPQVGPSAADRPEFGLALNLSDVNQL